MNVTILLCEMMVFPHCVCVSGNSYKVESNDGLDTFGKQ